MVDYNPDLLTTLVQNTAEAELSIIACLATIFLYSRYSKPRKIIDYCLGIGLLALIAFRIYKGIF
jgi:hypothetical protein